jgi:heme exporter protein D
MRNLFAMGRYRLVLWLCLLCTATPFHLLYVFSPGIGRTY